MTYSAPGTGSLGLIKRIGLGMTLSVGFLPVAVLFNDLINLNHLNRDFNTEFQDKVVNKKLEERVSSLLNALDSMPYDIVANRELDKFYYMQKLAELRLLDDKLYETLERVRVMMAGRYDTRREVMMRWRRDIRWLALRSREFDAIEE